MQVCARELFVENGNLCRAKIQQGTSQFGTFRTYCKCTLTVSLNFAFKAFWVIDEPLQGEKGYAEVVCINDSNYVN